MGYFLPSPAEAAVPEAQNPLPPIGKGKISGYRYYNPEMGKWVSRDPIGEWGGENCFQFVYNEPISYVDDCGSMPKLLPPGRIPKQLPPHNDGGGTHWPEFPSGPAAPGGPIDQPTNTKPNVSPVNWGPTSCPKCQERQPSWNIKTYYLEHNLFDAGMGGNGTVKYELESDVTMWICVPEGSTGSIRPGDPEVRSRNIGNPPWWWTQWIYQTTKWTYTPPATRQSCCE